MSIVNQLKSLYFAGRISQQMLWERFGAQTRTNGFSNVPTMDELLEGKWLSSVLCRDHAGAKVVAVEQGRKSSGTTNRCALKVTYNDIGLKAMLPNELFIKTCDSYGSRIVSGLLGLGNGEALFYNKVRPRLNLRSPRAYYAAYDVRTYRAILLLQDLSASGYKFPDALGCSVDKKDAESMVEQMAVYHGVFWDSPELVNGELSTLPTSMQFQILQNNMIGFEKNVKVGIKRSHSVIPTELYTRKKEIWPAIMRSAKLNVQGPMTLIHQDTHLGNWLRDPAGNFGLYDWQCVARGGWALDYSYAISCALTVENRRKWERDLLKYYLECLKAEGVSSPPTFEEAWLAYRQQIFHAFAFGVFTIGRSFLHPKMQTNEWCLVAIGRFAQMMADLDSLNSLS